MNDFMFDVGLELTNINAKLSKLPQIQREVRDLREEVGDVMAGENDEDTWGQSYRWN